MKFSILFLSIALILCMGYLSPHAMVMETEVAIDGEINSFSNEQDTTAVSEEKIKEEEKTAKKTGIQRNKRGMKDWSKIDYNAMDKSWEGGDDERELDHEFEIRYFLFMI
jgi:streptomycin 6-kinase